MTQLVTALRELVAAPNWAALTICEVNPDHGELDGSTIRTFSEAVAGVLAGSMASAGGTAMIGAEAKHAEDGGRA